MTSSLISKVVLFSLFLNLSVGVIVWGVLDGNDARIFGDAITSGYQTVGEQQMNDFQNGLAKKINPSGVMDDRNDQLYRLMDSISLGFVYRFFKMIDDFMYGFVNMLDNMIGQYMNPNLRGILFGNHDNDDLIPNSFGLLKLILTLAYMIYGIGLFTGKNVIEGRS